MTAAAPFAASGSSSDAIEPRLDFYREFSADSFITGSLDDSLAIAGVPRAAAEETERALAQAIDLDRDVRTGDRFYVRWQLDYSIDNQPLGTGYVLAVELRTARKGTIAISRFRPLKTEPGAPTPFYFANGQEAGPAPVRLPLDRIQITSGFGLRPDPLDQPERVPPVVAPAPPPPAAPPPIERKVEDKQKIVHAYMGFDQGQLGNARDLNGRSAQFSDIDRIMAERRIRAREEEERLKIEREQAEQAAAARVAAPPPSPAPKPVLLYMHEGLDLLANYCTPIYAAADGTVTVARLDRGYGNAVHLEHNQGLATIYGHLSRFATGIEPGVHVARGQTIGYVGSTGRSTGAHLHFEVLVKGRPVDPQTMLHPAQLSGFDLVRLQKQLARERQERSRSTLY